MAASALRKENLAYETQAAPSPRKRRENGPRLHELPLVKPRNTTREDVQARIRVNVRAREEYSIFPVIALACVAFMAVLIIMGYVELDGIYADTVVARQELSALQEEEIDLLAQYEEVFDRAALESAVLASGTDLTEATSDQKVYVDLSEPDNAVLHGEDGSGGLLGSLMEFWNSLLS